MSKSDQLKNSMKGGLNGLLSSTAPTNTDKSNRTTKIASGTETKEKPVHCNFVIEKSIHTRMKYLAIERNMSLKDIVNAAMKEYLDKYENKK